MQFSNPHTDVCKTTGTGEHFKHRTPAKTGQTLQIQFTTAVKTSHKQCHRLVASRAHRWSIFPAERESVNARLMLSLHYVVSVSRVNCTCVCIRIYECVCACVCNRKKGIEWENYYVFQVEGQFQSLLLSIQQSSSLWRGLREALFRFCWWGLRCSLAWSMRSKPLSFKGTAQGWQAFLHFNNKAGGKITEKIFYL